IRGVFEDVAVLEIDLPGARERECTREVRFKNLPTLPLKLKRIHRCRYQHEDFRGHRSVASRSSISDHSSQRQLLCQIMKISVRVKGDWFAVPVPQPTQQTLRWLGE